MYIYTYINFNLDLCIIAMASYLETEESGTQHYCTTRHVCRDQFLQIIHKDAT